MLTIWKFPLEVTEIQDVKMPQGARVLAVQAQHGRPCLWAFVNTERPNESRRIHMYDTGYPIPIPCEYIGTFQSSDGVSVFHVLEYKD